MSRFHWLALIACSIAAFGVAPERAPAQETIYGLIDIMPNDGDPDQDGIYENRYEHQICPSEADLRWQLAGSIGSPDNPYRDSSQEGEVLVFEGFYRPTDATTKLAVHSDDGVNVYINCQRVLDRFDTPQHLPDVQPYGAYGAPDSFHVIQPDGGWTTNQWYHIRIEYKNVWYEGLGDIDGLTLLAFQGAAEINNNVPKVMSVAANNNFHRVDDLPKAVFNVAGVKQDAAVTLNLTLDDNDKKNGIDWSNGAEQDEDDPLKATVTVDTSVKRELTVKYQLPGGVPVPIKRVNVWPVWCTHSKSYTQSTDYWLADADAALRIEWNEMMCGRCGKFQGRNNISMMGHGVGFEFTVSPEGVDGLAKVKFDVTRQMQVLAKMRIDEDWLVVRKESWPGREDLKLDGPTEEMNAKANDDKANNDDDNDPSQRHIYSIDQPGPRNPIVRGGETAEEVRYQANFLEFVRVKFDGTEPIGNKIDGSVCSNKVKWYTRQHYELTDDPYLSPIAHSGAGLPAVTATLDPAVAEWANCVMFITKAGNKQQAEFQLSVDNGEQWVLTDHTTDPAQPVKQKGATLSFPEGNYVEWSSYRYYICGTTGRYKEKQGGDNDFGVGSHKEIKEDEWP